MNFLRVFVFALVPLSEQEYIVQLLIKTAIKSIHFSVFAIKNSINLASRNKLGK